MRRFLFRAVAAAILALPLGVAAYLAASSRHAGVRNGAAITAVPSSAESTSSAPAALSAHVSSPEDSEDSASAPSPEELALLSPLRVEADLLGWQVVRIEGASGGPLTLHTSKDGRRIRLLVALDTGEAPMPAATAGRYAVFYSARHNDHDEALELARAVAEVLRKNQPAVVPPTLGFFHPRPKPGIFL